MSDFTKTDASPLLSLAFHNLGEGTASATAEFVFTNPKDYALQNVRLFYNLMTGGFEDGTNEQGQEVQDEQWVEVRVSGDVTWVPIGGPYGLDDAEAEEGTNFLQLDDIPVDGDVTIEVRVNVPSGIDLERIAVGRLGVSWDDELSSGVP